MFIFEKNPKNLKKPVEIALSGGTIVVVGTLLLLVTGGAVGKDLVQLVIAITAAAALFKKLQILVGMYC